MSATRAISLYDSSSISRRISTSRNGRGKAAMASASERDCAARIAASAGSTASGSTAVSMAVPSSAAISAGRLRLRQS